EQGRRVRRVGGGGQRGQRDHLIGQRQVRVEGQVRLLTKLIPAGPFPLTQCSQQPLAGRRALICAEVVARGAAGARGRRWGSDYLHCAQQRGDMDQQRFGIRRVIQLGGGGRDGWPCSRTAGGSERGARAAEVFRPVSGRERIAVQVHDRVG